MINLSPERIAEIKAEHQARKQKLDADEALYKQMQNTQREQQQEFWKKINKLEFVKSTEKAYKCHCCNCTIPAHSPAWSKPENVNVSGWGWQGQTLTRHYCAVCAGAIKKDVEL
jgi:hypothetical protein